jgi:acetyl esterase
MPIVHSIDITGIAVSAQLDLVAIVLALGGSLFGTASAAAQENLCAQRAGTVGTQPQPASLTGATPYVYKSIQGIDLHLHVFNPAASGKAASKRPAIVFFFGGAWMIGSVTELVRPAEYFSSRGATAILVEYRVFCRSGADIVDEIADAKSAVRWVRSHAGELAIDPDRIVVSGASSGGHLALSTAMFRQWDEAAEDPLVSSKPNLLVLFYPCVDETTPEERSYGGDAIGAHGKDVSPLYHIVAGLPATILFQGTADSLYSENKRYCEAARAKGNRCEFVEYRQAPHGFFHSGGKTADWYAKGLHEMDRFLMRAGYLTALGTSPASSN